MSVKCFKDIVRSVGGVFACFFALALIDVYLFIGVPETVKQVIGTSLLAGSIALLCLVVPCLSLRFRRGLVFAEFVLILVFEVVQLVAKTRFDMVLNGDWILLVLGTSWSEILDLLNTCSISVVLVALTGCLLFCGIGFYLSRRVDCVHPRRLWLRCVLMGGLVLPYFAMVTLYRLQGNETTCLTGSGVIRFIADTGKRCKTYFAFDAVRNSPHIPVLTVDKSALGACPIYVIGIGESVTRNHMSLYGYGRQTTPCLDALRDQLIVYTDCIARYRSTEQAVAYTYIHFDPRSKMPDYTLPQVVQAAGYDCVRLSMQKSWSARSLVDGVLFDGVESYGDYLKKEGSGYDDKLLPLLEREIARHEGRPLVLFLHFRGSHFEYSQRYPKETGTVFADDFSDEVAKKIAGGGGYRNSIGMTIASVIQMRFCPGLLKCCL